MPARTAGGARSASSDIHGRRSSSSSHGKPALRSSRIRRRGRSSALWSFNAAGHSSSKRARPGEVVESSFVPLRETLRTSGATRSRFAAIVRASARARPPLTVKREAAVARFARHGDLNRLPPGRIATDRRSASRSRALFKRDRRLEITVERRVRFQRLIHRPPRGDSSIFEEFDDLDGGQQSLAFRHASEDFLGFGRGLQQGLYATAPIEPALAGADQQRAHAKRGLGLGAFVGGPDPIDPRRGEGQQAAPKRSTKRAEQTARPVRQGRRRPRRAAGRSDRARSCSIRSDPDRDPSDAVPSVGRREPDRDAPPCRRKCRRCSVRQGLGSAQRRGVRRRR